MNHKALIVGVCACILAGTLTWAGYTAVRQRQKAETKAEMERLFSSGTIEEMDEAVENPPVSSSTARKIADRYISFTADPTTRLMKDGNGCLYWQIGILNVAEITIDARTSEILSVYNSEGLKLIDPARNNEDTARELIKKLGWPSPNFIELVNPKTSPTTTEGWKSIWWQLEIEGVPVDGLIGVTFNENNQPTWAGRTWIIIDAPVKTPKIPKEQATNIGKEKATKFGWTNDRCKSEGQLIWQRPIDVETFGHGYRLTWATIHSNPSPRPSGVPSKAYVYVDALTGDVTGIDYTLD